MTIKGFIITILVTFAVGLLLGIWLCGQSHKEPTPTTYDISHISDSILAANKHSDTVIIELKGEIKYEKGKLMEKFIAIDSLSYDSSFKLWQQSARQYKPYAN